MRGLKRLVLGVAALGGALAIGGLIMSSVFAASGSASISSGSAAPGESGSVELSANVGDPGLGAWTIDISYDTSVVSVADCAPAQGGVCNPEFGDGVIRITGASATGLDGDTSLGTIELDCGDEEGTSPLTLALDVFADATIGDPQPVDPATTNDGEFACEVPEPTEPAPTATLAAGGVPDVGTGIGGDSGSSLGWVIAALAGAGLAAMASMTALRLRSRRS